MNEPPGAHLRVALAGLAITEYFRNEKHQDVLLLIDSIFRFSPAGSEVSAFLGRTPCAVGYQPTLASDQSISRGQFGFRHCLLRCNRHARASRSAQRA